jgi:hypothetical protein
MTTEEILTLLEHQFPGWNRDGIRGILPYLNVAQKILCNVESDQLLIFDESTGKLPTITTVDGTYTYDLPDTVSFISSVVVEVGDLQPNSVTFFQQDYGRINRLSNMKYDTIEISGVSYYEIPYVRSYPATEDNAAKVIFTHNPGSTTDVYRYSGYPKPAELVSDTIPLTIPPPQDVLLLLPATAKLIEAVENGNYLEAYNALKNEFREEIQKEYNKGAFVYKEPEDRGF